MKFFNSCVNKYNDIKKFELIENIQSPCLIIKESCESQPNSNNQTIYKCF